MFQSDIDNSLFCKALKWIWVVLFCVAFSPLSDIYYLYESVIFKSHFRIK